VNHPRIAILLIQASLSTAKFIQMRKEREFKKKKKKKKGTHFKEAYFSEATYANLLAPIHTIFTKDIEKMEKEKET
jgi:hypothetical protein